MFSSSAARSNLMLRMPMPAVYLGLDSQRVGDHAYVALRLP